MGTLVTIPLAGDALVRPLGIIRRRGKELGKTARRFIQLLHERAQEDSQGLSDSAPSSEAELVGDTTHYHAYSGFETLAM